MNRLIALTLGTMLVVAAAVGGCNSIKAPLEGRQDPYEPQQIMFADPGLRRQTAVSAPSVSRDEADILYVTVPIRAATDRQLYVDYRASFYDQRGQLLSQSAWLTKTLAPNVPDQVTVNSMTPRAVDFQIDFRWAK